MKLLRRALIVAVAVTASAIQAQTIDGTLIGDESAYGSALSVQNTDTNFGNSVLGDPRFAGGSELNQVFGTISGGRLNLLITGNLESNFNKLEIFIDSEPGTGVNVIDGPSLPAAVDAFCCGGFGTTDGALQRMNGLTFDEGFNADRYLTFSNGTESVGAIPTDFWALTAHYADLTNGTSGLVVSTGMQINPFGAEPGLGQGEIIDQNNNGWDGPEDPLGSPAEHEFVEPVAPSDPGNDRNHRDMINAIDLRMAIDNSNIEGVNGVGAAPWDNTGNPETVVTGIEFSIPLSFIGNPTGDVRATIFINGGGHDFASNQFAGDGILDGNLGGDGFGGFTGDLAGVNLANIAGDQFVTISQAAGAICDLDGSGSCDTDDMRFLYDDIAAGTLGGASDLDGSGTVDNDDIDDWLAAAGTENGKVYLAGDTDLDGSVGGPDFTALASSFGNTGLPGAYWDDGNFNGNAGGSFGVGGSDFTALAVSFGHVSANAVPEPGSIGILLMGLLAVMGVARSKR